MPQMANIIWMQMYFLFPLMLFFMLASLSPILNKMSFLTTSLTINTPKKNMKW